MVLRRTLPDRNLNYAEKAIQKEGRFRAVRSRNATRYIHCAVLNKRMP